MEETNKYVNASLPPEKTHIRTQTFKAVLHSSSIASN
jgi:hypothetical protein